ncbi:response regulator [Tautonia sociabilis]|uniref:Response regulator n=1 Tax=Tautonia sociabilis TaxID=2080755 RepID=A0A432MPE3_9BACT|nr:response regulator [Tautonia sociabilis]RUL89037.1 response regulator [Tautonia sociabilis]
MLTLLTPTDGDLPATLRERPPFVLLVDDDSTGRTTLARLLDSAGHCCVDVGSGDEALELCVSLRPVLVITDLCMPGLDGRGLGRLLRSRFPKLSLILITAQPLDDDTRTELLGTFDDVLSKPVDGDRLLDRVARLAH